MSNTLTCHETARHLSALFTPPQALSLLRGVTARLAKCGTVTVVASNKPGWRVDIGSLRDVAFAARTDGCELSIGAVDPGSIALHHGSWANLQVASKCIEFVSEDSIASAATSIAAQVVPVA